MGSIFDAVCYLKETPSECERDQDLSPVAEANYNFGTGGVVAIGVIAGSLLGLLPRLRLVQRNPIWIGLLMFPVMYTVRNPSTAVLAQGVLAMLLVSAAYVQGRLTSRVS